MPATDRPRGFMVWVGDFLSDPNVMAMDTTEVGAFWLLLLCAAQQGGTLPNDDAMLARLTRLSPEEWATHRDAVLRAWVVTPRSITQKRLVQEVRAAERRQAAGRAAANARHHTELRTTESNPQCDGNATALLRGSGSRSEPTEEPTNAAEPRLAAPDPEANQRSVLGLLGGMAERMAVPNAGSTKNQPTKLAWDWLSGNASREESTRAMAFVGWLLKTGTRDPEMLLALVKDYVVHHPDNPHAYYTPKGMARQNIVTRVAADRAVAEHERIKREERAFLGRQ